MSNNWKILGLKKVFRFQAFAIFDSIMVFLDF